MELEPVKSIGAVQIESVRQTPKGKTPAPELNPQTKRTMGTSEPNVPVFGMGGKAVTVGNVKDEEAKERQLKSAVTQVNSKLKSTRTRCEYTYDDTVNRIAIKVIDEETGDVIKEIPPEETLKMIEKMWEIAGILMDKKL